MPSNGGDSKDVPEDSKELQPRTEKKEDDDKSPSGSAVDLFLSDPSVPKSVREMATFMASVGPSYPPFLSKVSAEHITKVLDSSENDSKRSHWRSMLFAILGGGLFLVAMIYLAPSNPELFEKVLTFLAGFGGGTGVGYGIAKYR